jgi:hypothetical protein
VIHLIQAQAFSFSLDEPTASSEVDQGEFTFTSAAGLDGRGYNDGAARLLLLEMLPQLLALPERECPPARGV